MAQCPVISCEICDNSIGRRFCMDCEQLFCKSCEISHLKTKSCVNHVFQDADKANPEVKTPICKQHGEKYTYYCNTCSSLTCNICLPTTHNKHDFCLIDAAASQTRSVLDREVKVAEDRIRRAKEKVTSFRLNLKNFEDEVDNTKTDIAERVAVITKALNDTKDSYFKSIDEHKSKESSKMKDEINKIENTIAIENDIQSLNQMKSLIDGQNDIILLDLFSDFTKTLKELSLLDIFDKESTAKAKFFSAAAKSGTIEKLIGSIKLVEFSGAEVKPNIKVGDRVRVKSSVKKPTLGWGPGVSHKSIGTVVDIPSNTSGLIHVKFPSYSCWEGYINEMELV